MALQSNLISWYLPRTARYQQYTFFAEAGHAGKDILRFRLFFNAKAGKVIYRFYAAAGFL
jgi:hypothetical protein